MDQQLEPRPTTSVTESARGRFSDEQRALIRDTIAPEADETAFEFLIELSARLELNPLLGEIFLASMPGRDGAPKRWIPIVGRDGFLRAARRQEGFVGVDTDVVREFDKFEVEHTAGGPRVKHNYTHERRGPPPEEGKPDDRPMRGRIVGAWAIVYHATRRPVYFYAPLDDYISGNRNWKQYPTAMIRKVAVANAVRQQFGLTGAYDESEMSHVQQVEGTAEEEPAWGENPELATWLQELVARLSELDDSRYRPAKVRMVLQGANDEEREGFADRLATEIAELGGEVPERTTPPEAEVVEPEPEPEVETVAEAASPEDPEVIDQLQHRVADIDLALETEEMDDEERKTLLDEANELQLRIDQAGPSERE